MIHAVFGQAHRQHVAWRPPSFPDVQIPLRIDDVAGQGQLHFDGNFGPLTTEDAATRVDGRSDVHVLFYLHLLSSGRKQTPRNVKIPSKISQDLPRCNTATQIPMAIRPRDHKSVQTCLLFCKHPRPGGRLQLISVPVPFSGAATTRGPGPLSV